MSISLPIDNFVTSITTLTGLALQTPNINNLALFTTEAPNNSELYGVYINSKSVENNYGTNSNTAKTARAIFSQAPNIISGGGRLIIFPLESGETIPEAIARVKDASYIYFYGIITNKTLDDDALEDVASYVQDKPNMFFHHASDIAKNANNGIIKAITDAGYTKTCIVLYPATNEIDAHLAKASIASLLFQTNFNASNSAINLHGKQLTGITGNSNITQTDLENSKTTGAMLYANFDSANGRIFESGANDFRDNIYYKNMLNINAQFAVANALLTTTTKLAQTDEDVDVLMQALTNVLQQAVRANIVAPNTWNGSDTFGDPVIFKRNISEQGFYIYHEPVALQSQADREARKAPVIQWAAKFSGAINFIELIGTVER